LVEQHALVATLAREGSYEEALYGWRILGVMQEAHRISRTYLQSLLLDPYCGA
jgi:hypothetical protein